MDRMTSAEIRSVREYLGLTIDTLAAHLSVNPRTVRSWEQGRDPVPARVTSEVAGAVSMTDLALASVVAHLRVMPHPKVVVYRTDDEMALDGHSLARFGARWLRHLAQRAAEQVPGARIVCAADAPST